MGLKRGLVATSEFMRHPSMVGSAFPASSRLVRRMLAPLAWRDIKVFVEYGPGTGQFTVEILNRLAPNAHLLAIETGEGFVEALRERCDDPRLIVVSGSAEDVNGHLAAAGLDSADCVLTGLPFSTLSEGEAKAIMQATAVALSPQGTLAAYQMRTTIRVLMARHFATLSTGFEWWNVPPCHLYWANRPVCDVSASRCGGGSSAKAK